MNVWIDGTGAVFGSLCYAFVLVLRAKRRTSECTRREDPAGAAHALVPGPEDGTRHPTQAGDLRHPDTSLRPAIRYPAIAPPLAGSPHSTTAPLPATIAKLLEQEPGIGTRNRNPELEVAYFFSLSCVWACVCVCVRVSDFYISFFKLNFPYGFSL